MSNIKIQGIEIYCPKNLVDNEYYLEHFKKQNKKVLKTYHFQNLLCGAQGGTASE